jgi:hypothetical protein
LTPSAPLRPVTPGDGSTSLLPTKLSRARPLFDPQMVQRAAVDALRKLNPEDAGRQIR